MAGNRAGIGAFTAAIAVAIAPLSVFATLFGFFVACYGDKTTRICNSDDPDQLYVAVIAVPVVLMLVLGGMATYRRSWRLALVGAGLAGLAVVGMLVVAYFMAEG